MFNNVIRFNIQQQCPSHSNPDYSHVPFHHKQALFKNKFALCQSILLAQCINNFLYPPNISVNGRASNADAHIRRLCMHVEQGKKQTDINERTRYTVE